jgi:hypothetical protein
MSLSEIPPRWFSAVLLIATFLASFGCASKRPPVPEQLMNLEPKTPVIIVPGLTGSKLRDPGTGKVLWGTTARLLSPHDGGVSLMLPLDPELHDDAYLVPFDVIHRMNFGLTKLDIYGGLIELLQDAGYRLGSLDDPQPGDTLFVVPYDWRRNNVSVAAELVEKLERLKRSRGDSELRVHAICHSNSARIVRYAMKYGGAKMADASAGRAGVRTADRA